MRVGALRTRTPCGMAGWGTQVGDRFDPEVGFCRGERIDKSRAATISLPTQTLAVDSPLFTPK